MNLLNDDFINRRGSNERFTENTTFYINGADIEILN